MKTDESCCSDSLTEYHASPSVLHERNRFCDEQAVKGNPCVRVYVADEVDALIKHLREYEWMYKELQK